MSQAISRPQKGQPSLMQPVGEDIYDAKPLTGNDRFSASLRSPQVFF